MKEYNSVTELGLSITTCTLNDIIENMRDLSTAYLPVGSTAYYGAPEDYGMLIIKRFNPSRGFAVFLSQFTSKAGNIYINNWANEVGFRGWYEINGSKK